MAYDFAEINSNTNSDWLVLRYADDCLWPMKSVSKITVHGILYIFLDCRSRSELGFGLLGLTSMPALAKRIHFRVCFWVRVIYRYKATAIC